MTGSCLIDKCKKPAKYTLEWYGYNQHGEDPLVVEEVDVCEDFEHIIAASYSDNLGELNGIVDYETKDEEQQELYKKVLKKLSGKKYNESDESQTRLEV